MADPPQDDRPPMVVAMQWVSKIMTVGLMMFLPGLAGQWLDEHLGTRFLTLVGFVLGLSTGMWYLLVLVRDGNSRRDGDK